MNSTSEREYDFDTPLYFHVLNANERYQESYLWIDIYFSESIAKISDLYSPDFLRALAWYDAFRWAHPNINKYLDSLLDSKSVKPNDIDNDEFLLYKHTWERRIISHGLN